MAPVLGMTSQQRDSILSVLSLWKRHCFNFTGIKSYSSYRFAFVAAYNASGKSIISGLTECLIILSRTVLLLTMAKERQYRVCAHEIHKTYHVPHHPKTNGLIELRKQWPFKDTVIAPKVVVAWMTSQKEGCNTQTVYFCFHIAQNHQQTKP